MPISETVRREFEVAFSRHSQPPWFRILKYVAITILAYFLWGTQWIWIVFLILFLFSLLLHFWYRHKTAGWTKSYKMWKHESDR
ncbi:MAG TPA: hypothetical protein VFF90_08395 [Saprospiraceae bacterium]|nr:hypothetical protein [Saprospiraceae bacterium]